MTVTVSALTLALGNRSIMCTTFIGAFVAPTTADTHLGYVKDVIAACTLLAVSGAISAVLSQMPDAGTQPTAEPPAQPAAV